MQFQHTLLGLALSGALTFPVTTPAAAQDHWRLANPGGGALLVEPTSAQLPIVENDSSVPAIRPVPLGPAFRVNASQELYHGPPAVAVAPNDEFLVVWASWDADYAPQGIFAQRYDSLGVAQGSEFLVQSSGLRGSSPSVAFDPAGNFVVVWRGPFQGRSFGSTGEALGDSFDLGIAADAVRVRPGPDGRFVVTWDEWMYGPIPYRPCIRQIELSGAFYGDSYCGGFGIYSVAATASSGDTLMLWEGREAVQAQRFDPAGQRQGETFQVSDGWAPAITADGSGTFVVAWEGPESSSYEALEDVFAQRLSGDGEPQSEIIHANSFTTGPQGFPQIAADAVGNFVVVWESSYPGTSSDSQDGSGSGVFGQRFNRSGMPVGGEFLIPTHTELNQRRPAIASHTNGEFVVVWRNERAEGGYDIMARRFSPNGCVEDANTLCLGNGRFQVRATWRDFAGNTGQGRVRTLTADTGYFWFFNPDNVEIVLKVLDGRLHNGHFWVFYGALSNVEYTLTVTDTQTGTMREYVNPLYQFASVGDTEALPVKGHPGSRPSASAAIDAASPGPRQGGCVADATSLCLNQGRFRIAVDWRDFAGETGVGHAESLTSDTGYFWFFDDANVEIVIKALDGTALNGHYWIFYGALSNVEYTITVTDTVTDTTRLYFNPASRFASVGDTMAFPGD